MGSGSRIRVLLREGCLVGKPKYPAGTSCATTNISDRLISAVNCIFSEMGAPFGQAEGTYTLQSGMAVISGVDPRKDDHPYVNQMFIGFGGGGANHGHDGWATYSNQASGGMVALDSIEIDESMYPILIRSRQIAPDTLGPGEWDGGPGMTGEYGPTASEMVCIYCSDGCVNAPRGVLGGSDATPTANNKRRESGELVRLPNFHEETCVPGETIHFVVSGGDGYGDPTKRDPHRVAATVNRGWLTREFAERTHKVVLRKAENGVEYDVDEAATAALRAK
jgi:N-methylhydantoinase B